jgi:hypothetical protein
MARDAFGNEQDDNALESLGWSASGDAPAPTLTPAAPPSPTPFAPPPLRLPDLSSPPRRGGHIAAVFGVLVATALVWLVIGVVGSHPSIHLPKIDTPDIGTPAKAPDGLDQKSMLRRGNLAPALRKLEAKVGGRVRLVRIEAERIDVQAVSGGRTINAQYRWDGDGATVISSSPAASTLATFSWSQINASAPARIVRATTRRGGAKGFDYAVLVDAAGLRWSGYTAASGAFLADARGRHVKPIGG